MSLRMIVVGLAFMASGVVQATAGDSAEVLTQGTAAYQAGDYEKAATLYRQLADAGLASADLFYNLGTAQLRAGRRGEAILWYERALRLDPHDADVKFNLAEAMRGNIDKVVGTREEIPFIERVGERVPDAAAGFAFALAWVVAFGALILRRLQGRAPGALVGVAVVAGLVAVTSAVLLWTAWWHRTQVRYAVVTAPAASVREGPAADFRTAFEIHEGLKVRVVRQQEDFLRVRLPNGTEGWVAAANAPLIQP